MVCDGDGIVNKGDCMAFKVIGFCAKVCKSDGRVYEVDGMV